MLAKIYLKNKHETVFGHIKKLQVIFKHKTNTKEIRTTESIWVTLYLFVPQNIITIWLSRSILPSTTLQAHPIHKQTEFQEHYQILSQGTSETHLVIVHSLCSSNQSSAGLFIFTSDVNTNTIHHSSKQNKKPPQLAVNVLPQR